MPEENAQPAQQQEAAGWFRSMATGYDYLTKAVLRELSTVEAFVDLEVIDKSLCGSLSTFVAGTSAVSDALNAVANYKESKYDKMANNGLDFVSHASKASGFETMELSANAAKVAKGVYDAGTKIYASASNTLASHHAAASPGDATVAKGLGERAMDVGNLAYTTVTEGASLGMEALKFAVPAIDSKATIVENGITGVPGSLAKAAASYAYSSISSALGGGENEVGQGPQVEAPSPSRSL